MALSLSPLSTSALSPNVARVAGPAAPAQLKLMAARGLAPLPPQELVVALYQIAVSDESEAGQLRKAAEDTARDLPENLLAAGLAVALDARVIDWFARRLSQRDRALQPLLYNPAADDQTFAWLASVADEALCEQVAANEIRLLRCPAIITALYLNRSARMSTAQRALELAIRNGVQVDGIPSYEDVKAAILSDPTPPDDAAFARVIEAIERESHVPEEEQVVDEATRAQADEAVAHKADQLAEKLVEDPKPENPIMLSKLTIGQKLRLAAVGNAMTRAMLVRDSNKVIALAAAKHPGVNEYEAERFAANRSLHEEVIRYLSGQRQLTKRYSVKLNLVFNPKCPLQASMLFLNHLTPRDLRTVSRSKGIPAALARAAQALLQKREH